ncbi:MAG: zinc ribbon domain-containing protein [Candidatus Hermodarchaeota archaeon]
MRISVIYEENLKIDSKKAFEITMQWLTSQRKAKIKRSTPPTFIEAKQGTMMTNTGHDPNWKKRIRISFFELEGNQSLIRVEAEPLARTIFRVEKLKQSWYSGLFSHLFSLLHTVSKSSKSDLTNEYPFEDRSEIRFCPYCGNKMEENAKICPKCGTEIE